jgi:hypothetical protein
MSNNLDIFLSYNNNDKKIIKTIANALFEKKYNVLYKDLDINNDNAWFKEIECFSNTINCIIIFTNDTLDSWQEFEISLFKENSILGESLNIPVIICGKKIPTNLPSYIDNYRFINFDLNEDSIDKLIDSIITKSSYKEIQKNKYQKIEKSTAKYNKLNNKFSVIFLVVFITCWIPLFYYGIITKNKKWILSSIFYAVLININTLIIFINNATNNSYRIFITLSIVSWIICIINTLLINKELLIRLKKLNRISKKEYQKILDKINYENVSMFNESKTKNKIKSLVIDSITKEINHTLFVINNNKKENLKITPILNDINSTINKLNTISKKKNILIYESFSNEIKNYKNSVNEILENYISCQTFLDKHKYINKEIEELEKNIILYDVNEQQYYRKILCVKKATLKELFEINKTIKNSELKLTYILSCLQNIEAIFEKNNLRTELESDETEDLNNYIESFKESINKSVNKTSV